MIKCVSSFTGGLCGINMPEYAALSAVVDIRPDSNSMKNRTNIKLDRNL